MKDTVDGSEVPVETEGGVQLGRLALRKEGQLWCAYYALPDTMDGAIFLGSIQVAAIEDERIKYAFIDIMRRVLSNILEEKTGGAPEWGGPEPAPEHERCGEA